MFNFPNKTVILLKYLAHPTFDLNKNTLLEHDKVYNDLFISRKNKVKSECISIHKFYVSVDHF